MSRFRNFWTYRKIFIHKKVRLTKLTFSELVKVHIGLALLSVLRERLLWAAGWKGRWEIWVMRPGIWKSHGCLSKLVPARCSKFLFLKFTFLMNFLPCMIILTPEDLLRGNFRRGVHFWHFQNDLRTPYRPKLQAKFHRVPIVPTISIAENMWISDR